MNPTISAWILTTGSVLPTGVETRISKQRLYNPFPWLHPNRHPRLTEAKAPAMLCHAHPDRIVEAVIKVLWLAHVVLQSTVHVLRTNENESLEDDLVKGKLQAFSRLGRRTSIRGLVRSPNQLSSTIVKPPCINVPVHRLARPFAESAIIRYPISPREPRHLLDPHIPECKAPEGRRRCSPSETRWPPPA